MSEFPCACCGFLVFDQPAGSFALCPVCNWEDDPVQLQFPGTPTGANSGSLYECQVRFLQVVPPDRQIHRGFRRDPTWRPLRLEEATNREGEPKTGRQYFDAISYDAPAYYWRSS
jgi:Cysteine-rich CPCC